MQTGVLSGLNVTQPWLQGIGTEEPIYTLRWEEHMEPMWC